MKIFLSKTKGSYLQKGKERKLRTYLLPILIAFLMLFFGKDVISQAVALVTMPLYTTRHYFETSAGTIPVFLRSRLDLNSEIQSLKQEVAESRNSGAVHSYLKTENEELRAMLSASSSPRIAAGVIARPPHTPYDMLIIDQGSDDGIVEHAPVFYGSNQAVGYVETVFQKSAQITLFSSPGIESTVYVFGPNIFTTAYGEGSGVIRLSVPQGILIQKSDVAILPSLEGGVLGTIDEIESTPTAPEQYAYITFDASLQSIRLVSVGREPILKTEFSEAEFRIQEADRELFTIVVPEHYTLSSTTISSTTLKELGGGVGSSSNPE